jgi:hypothetical protein
VHIDSIDINEQNEQEFVNDMLQAYPNNSWEFEGLRVYSVINFAI